MAREPGTYISPFADVKNIAVAIAGSAVTHDIDQRHVGILIRTQDDEIKLLHLAWHFRLQLEDPVESYCWVECDGIDTMNQQLLCDWLLTMSKFNLKTVPYSIKYDGEPYFDETGKLLKNKPGEGLTCATFVLSSFSHLGFDLLDLRSWKPRDEDEAWKEKILRLLEKHNVSAEHIDAQKRDLSEAVRYRPEEVVAGALLYKGAPISFEQASKIGKTIANQTETLST